MAARVLSRVVGLMRMSNDGTLPIDFESPSPQRVCLPLETRLAWRSSPERCSTCLADCDSLRHELFELFQSFRA